MGRSAAAFADSRVLPAPAQRRQDAPVEGQSATQRKQLGFGRRLRPGRRQLGLIALLIVGAWVVFSFGRTITQLNAASERQAVVAGETAALAAQLAAGQREVELVDTDGFQALQARAFGIGAPGEIAFSLETGAPAATRLAPLGSSGPGAQPVTPLDAWLRLLFGD